MIPPRIWEEFRMPHNTSTIIINLSPLYDPISGFGYFLQGHVIPDEGTGVYTTVEDMLFRYYPNVMTRTNLFYSGEIVVPERTGI